MFLGLLVELCTSSAADSKEQHEAAEGGIVAAAADLVVVAAVAAVVAAAAAGSAAVASVRGLHMMQMVYHLLELLEMAPLLLHVRGAGFALPAAVLN